jgi:hypothetical protein
VIDAVLRHCHRLEKKRRRFPLRSALNTARDELKVLQARSIRREDFDAQKISGSHVSGMGVRAISQRKSIPRNMPAEWSAKGDHLNLEPFFGDLRLADIRWTKIMEYRTKRLNEPIMRRGKPALIYRATKKSILLDGQSGTRVLTFPVKPCRRMMDL